MSQKNDCNGDNGTFVDCEDINPWECYYPNKRNDCCVTCDGIRNDTGVPIPGCDYGDRMPQECSNIPEPIGGHCYNNTVREACCNSCYFQEVGISGCDYGDRTPQECGNMPEPIGGHCYNNTVREACCYTCFQEEVYIPGGCTYGDRVPGCLNITGPYGRYCYNNTIQNDCCGTCFSLELNIPGCRYGDKVGNCQGGLCSSYSNTRFNDCCATCFVGTSNPPPTYPTTTLPPTTNGTTNPGTTGQLPGDKGSSDSSGWIIPVAAGVGGVVVLIIIILVACFLIRRRKKKPDVITDEMYKEYKLSKRAPVAPPRPDIEDARQSKLVRQDSAEYAYIHPNDVASDPGKEQSLKKREGSDPLPQVPGEYVYLTNRDAYGYFEPVKRSSKSEPYTSLDAANRQPGPYAHLNQATDETARRTNSYENFPQGTHDNKGFLADSVKL